MSDKEPSTLEVRDWAVSKGYDCASRGKLAAFVLRAWNDAHPDRPVRVPHDLKMQQWGSYERSRAGGLAAHRRDVPRQP